MESVTDYQTGLLIGLWLGLLFGIAGTAGVALLLSCKPTKRTLRVKCCGGRNPPPKIIKKPPPPPLPPRIIQRPSVRFP